MRGPPWAGPRRPGACAPRRRGGPTHPPHRFDSLGPERPGPGPASAAGRLRWPPRWCPGDSVLALRAAGVVPPTRPTGSTLSGRSALAWRGPTATRGARGGATRASALATGGCAARRRDGPTHPPPPGRVPRAAGPCLARPAPGRGGGACGWRPRCPPGPAGPGPGAGRYRAVDGPAATAARAFPPSHPKLPSFACRAPQPPVAGGTAPAPRGWGPWCPHGPPPGWGRVAGPPSAPHSQTRSGAFAGGAQQVPTPDGAGGGTTPVPHGQAPAPGLGRRAPQTPTPGGGGWRDHPRLRTARPGAGRLPVVSRRSLPRVGAGGGTTPVPRGRGPRPRAALVPRRPPPQAGAGRGTALGTARPGPA
ncbi:hypothetical protein FHS40_002762 [Streptomyces spectabilis]|uniref:Uncharacterized protein n=1 Tax=Streptomyces spectabilis TaxID=68270 RepID=A0A7W8AUM4_STRST|nr:hypothetical protein [Streptomyces spectabilis]